MKIRRRPYGILIVLALFIASCGLVSTRVSPPSDRAPAPVTAPPPPAVSSTPESHGRAAGPESETKGFRLVRVLVGTFEVEAKAEGGRFRVDSPRGETLGDFDGPNAVRVDDAGFTWGKGKFADSPIDIVAPAGGRLGGVPLLSRTRLYNRKGKILAVAVVPFEEYVARVLSREFPRSFASASLEAGAVAVRTYAVSVMAKPRDPVWDLLSSMEDQVFDASADVSTAHKAAVDRTKGEVLYFGDAPARAVFHASCGGRTESAVSAWGRAFPYLVTVECVDCRHAPSWRWEQKIDQDEADRIGRSVGVASGRIKSLAVGGRTPSGRVHTVEVGSDGASKPVTGSAFRKAAGYSKVRSLAFDIKSVDGRKGGWVASGTGYGHGVGLCQWGSDGMADRGKAYREILDRYYPGARIVKRG